MKIFVTGGTGFVGSKLTRALMGRGHHVTILTRSMERTGPLPEGSGYVEGNPMEKGPWQEALAGHDAVINLAGASIFTRWNDNTKAAIRESRLLTTQNLVEAVSGGGKSAAGKKDFLFLSTSAIGYYGFHGDEELVETDPAGDDFLATLAKDWEDTARGASSTGARLILLRFGVVLDKTGGALKQMVSVFNKYMGSPMGSGEQWFSWIHMDDLIGIYLFLIEQEGVSGPINCTAPQPVRNREMVEALGEALGKPTFMPSVPGFVVRLMMGEFGSVLLKGQRVLPRRLLDMGFQFKFPEIETALKDLFG